MAESAVEFLLENLQQLLVYHANLIKDAKEPIEKLHNDLRLLLAFLKDTTKKRRKDDILQELVRQIRDVVYEAEDIIDSFVTQAASAKSRNYFTRVFRQPVSLYDITKRVEAINSEVKQIYGDKGGFGVAILNSGDAEEEEKAPVVRQENVVGFEDEAQKIIGYLLESTDELDVITIIGMPGLGKTTLAGKIFRDNRIQSEFPTCLWVYVSQEFKKKEVYLAILRGFTTITQEMTTRSDAMLAQMVHKYLEGGKFLIVMDGVWTVEDWNEIQVVLPKSNSDGKVLITSRHEEVARHANRQRNPFKLRFLTPDESWLLLQLEVFGKPNCPPELEVPGKIIVMECYGLPMTIVLIAGILVKNSSDNINLMKVTWDKVSASVWKYLNADPAQRMEKIIALSYDKLPHHLRVCFLYMGMFPEDFEIPVGKLIQLWIAEGFVREKDGASMEEIAENYLHELINRNLVRADKRRPDGRVKTCRFHNMIRQFCLSEAGSQKENFFLEMKRTPDGFEPTVAALERCRRICIHSNVLNFISHKPWGPRVRSFVCCSKEDLNLPPESTSAIPAAFKLLRVLDAKPMIFGKIPRDMYQLVHLRYLTLSFSSAVLPGSFEKLWNLETLIVDTPSRTLEIRANIWKMIRLRHIEANASVTLPKVGNISKEGENLQTLGTISPGSCTEEVFVKGRNLKKLGIRGNLAALLEGKAVSFHNLAKLVNLEKLNLLNDVFPGPASEGRLPSLPPPYQFPPKLKSITLSNTFLDWKHISVLGLLERLEVLKLENSAFIGNIWEADDGLFRRLEVLHIGRTDLCLWKASKDHFPRLKCLQLHYCEELQEIPVGLADIPSFHMLDLYGSPNAAISAKKIGDMKQKIWEEQNIKYGEFKLSIYPPPAF